MTTAHDGAHLSAAEATRRVAEASPRGRGGAAGGGGGPPPPPATAELHKQGTPDYDPRQHEKAVERERRALDGAHEQADRG
jgi:hypothetical protein